MDFHAIIINISFRWPIKMDVPECERVNTEY